VQVEAVVTDKRGDRVSGLTREDFRLRVDGEEVPIDYFEEVRQGITVTEGERTRSGRDREGSSEIVGEEQMAGRDFLVFVDDYFTDRGTRKRLLKNLAKNVDTLGPKDRMAVVRFAGWGLEIRTDWTSSRDELADVFGELIKETPQDLTRSSEIASMSDSVLQLDDAKLTDRRRRQQIEDVVSGMAVAMRAFADTPNRKLLVPVTLGWAFDPSRAVGAATALNTAELARDANDIGSAAPRLGSLNATGAPTPAGRGGLSGQAEQADVYGDSPLSPLVDTANLLGYSIYPMHLGRPSPDDLQRTSLWTVALETGGQIATEGGASTTPLVPVVADTGSYYVLGFSPERAFDDRRHALEVQARRPEGAEVRHRRSFVDLSRGTRRAMVTEEAIFLGREGGDLDVTLGEARQGRGGSVEVPLTLRIPMDWVTMIPQNDERTEYAGDLELRVAAMDKDGRRSETTAVPVRLSGPEPPPGSVATYETAVQLRNAEEQRLVLYLYDRLSGESRATALEYQP